MVEKICDICDEKYDTMYVWKVNISYAACGYDSLNMCPACIQKALGCNADRMRFFAEMVNFKKVNSLQYGDEWPEDLWKGLAIQLKRKGIPIRNYGFPLWLRKERYKEIEHGIIAEGYRWFEVHLHELVGEAGEKGKVHEGEEWTWVSQDEQKDTLHG